MIPRAVVVFCILLTLVQSATQVRAVHVTLPQTPTLMPQEALLEVKSHESSGLEILYLDSMVKAFPNMSSANNNTAEVWDNVTISAAGNEHSMFQIGLTIPCGISNFTFDADLSSVSSESFTVVIKQVEWTTVKYPVNKDRQTGYFPDPLPPYKGGPGYAPPAGYKTTFFWIDVEVLPSFPTPQASGMPARIGSLVVSVKNTTTDNASSSSALYQIAVPVYVSRCHFDIPVGANASLSTDMGIVGGKRMFNGTKKENPAGWAGGYLPEQLLSNLDTVIAYYRNVQQHRVNRLVWEDLLPYSRMTITFSEDLSQAVLNTTHFDASVEYLLTQGFSQGFRLPSPLGASSMIEGCHHTCSKDVSWMFWSDPSSSRYDDGDVSRTWRPRIFQNPNSTADPYALNPEFATLFNLTYKAVVQHLESKGWLDLFSWAQFIDEPAYEDPWTCGIVYNFAKMFKGLHPKIKWSQTRFPIPQVPELMPLADAWIAHVEQINTPGALDNMTYYHNKYGTQLTTYNNGIPIIDLSAVRVRALPWALWQTNNGAIRNLSWFNTQQSKDAALRVSTPSTYPAKVAGLQGSLSWYSILSWTANRSWPTPWELANQDPMCAPPKGKCPYDAAGWGWLLYPPRDLDMRKAPVSSTRWEQLMLGLQDAEYFFLLQNAVLNQHQKKMSQSAAPSQECLAAVKVAEEALFNTTSVVWGFPQVRQFTSTPQAPLPYTEDTAAVAQTKHVVGLSLNQVIAKC